MKRVDNDIKLLLPDYVAGELDPKDQTKVRTHLDSCEDCRKELSLLRMMSNEDVPEPSDAFWAAFPGRVYRIVQDNQYQRNSLMNLQGLLHKLFVPRWIQAVAACIVILSCSWFIVHETLQKKIVPPLPGEEYTVEDNSPLDPVLRHTSATIAELTPSELATADAWAEKRLSSLAMAAGANATNLFDTDLNEELAELNIQEVDRLSITLRKLEEEG